MDRELQWRPVASRGAIMAASVRVRAITNEEGEPVAADRQAQ
jgi:hypothetical protein